MNIKISAALLLALAATVSCERFEAKDRVFDNSLYFDVSATGQMLQANFNNRTETFSQELSVMLSYPSEEDVTATVSVDGSLVAEYNSRYGTDYEMVPSSYLDFASQTVTIPAGHTVSEAVSIGLKGLTGTDGAGGLEIDKTWLLPVSLTSSEMAAMSGASVAYYLVKRSSAITVAAQLTDNWINFPLLDSPGEVADVYNDLTAVTYEALIYIDKFDTVNGFGDCNISTVMGVEQYLLLRIGDANFERQQLQFDGSGSASQFGKIPTKSDASKKLESGQWYHVACTYDQSARCARIFLNGRLLDESKDAGVTGAGADNRITLAMRALGSAEAYQFMIGKSYNDYRPLQGKIAEARVWRVARTEDQIWDNMYRITEPENEPDLIGYWKFDEGEGNVIHDSSLYGNHGEAQYDVTWPSGIEIPEINKEEE